MKTRPDDLLALLKAHDRREARAERWSALVALVVALVLVMVAW